MGLSMAMVSGFANAAASGTVGGQGHGTVHFKGEIIDSWAKATDLVVVFHK